MKTQVYGGEGKAVREISLPEKVFGVTWNPDLVHQVVTAMLANKRAGTAHTKSRGEVRGGGKKPWKQKGTGRARHGSTRSPIWRGGGVTHGPRVEKNYKEKINAKMRIKALLAVLSAKHKTGEMLFVENVTFTGKTKDASKVFTALSKVDGFKKLTWKKKGTTLVILPGKDTVITKSIRNIPSISYEYAKDINAVDILNAKIIVCFDPEKTLPVFESKVK